MAEFNAADSDDELLSAYLDDELAPEERARVEERLAADPRARQLLDELRSVSRAMQDLPPATLGTDLRESVLRRAERAMLVTGDRASARGQNEAIRKLPFGRSKRAWAWAGAALAAGLLLMVFQAEPGRQNDVPDTVAKRERSSQLEMRSVDQPREEVADRERSLPAVDAASPAEAPGLGGGEAVGGVAEEVAAASSPLAGDDLVVVYLNVKPEALRDNAIDAVLARNQIEMEVPAAGKSDADAPRDVDLVWVEAAPAQIMSSLAEINADHTNYVSIAVEDELAPTQRARAAQQPAVDLKRYSRGATPPQKLQVAPNNNLYYQTTHGQIEIDRGRVGGEGVAGRIRANEGFPLADEGQAQQVAPPVAMTGRAAGERTMESFGSSASTSAQPAAPSAAADSYRNAKLGAARRAMQKLAAKADMLQVLFVLAAADESASSPAPTDSPE